MNDATWPDRALGLGTGLTRFRQLTGLVVALVAIPLITALLLPIRADVGLQTVLLLFVLACVVASVVGGLAPAAVAALGGFSCANLFFTPPYGSFFVQKERELWDLLVFLAVAISVGLVVEIGARDRARAERAKVEAAVAADLGRREPGTHTVAAVLSEACERFSMDGVALLGAGGQPLATVGDTSGHISGRTPAGQGLELVLYGPAVLGSDPRLLGTLGSTAGRLWRAELVAAEAARAEQLARVDQQRSSLLAAVGHDLRTPLATIKASVSTLRQDDLELDEPDRAELLIAIEANADRLAELIANLLDMSRLQAGELSVRFAPVAIAEVLVGALRLADGRVELDLPEDLPLVRADAGLLERVLENLVDNAKRHIPAGEVVLLQARDNGGQVHVSVIDHGPGVPQERFDSMFQPFQRFDDRSTGGVGLGLAIARGFTEAMGGTLTPAATPGGGLTMRLTLAAAR